MRRGSQPTPDHAHGATMSLTSRSTKCFPRKRSTRRAAFEPLEQRRLFAVDYLAMANDLASRLTALSGAMGNIDDPANRVPVINAPLSELPAVQDVFKHFQQPLVNAVKNLVDPTADAIREAIWGALGDNPANPNSLDILADQNNNGTSDAGDVNIPVFDPAAGNVTIQLDLAKHFDATSPNLTFGLGIDNLPLNFDTAGDLTVGVDFTYNDFTFGAAGGAPMFDDSAASELALGINADL